MRFRPEQHLRRQADFRAVRAEGRRIDCGAFTLWWRRRPRGGGDKQDRPVVRLGLAASIAAVGNSVERNRARRRLRDLFRRHQDLLPPGIDVFLVARAAVNRLAADELEERFIGACRRLRPAKDS